MTNAETKKHGFTRHLVPGTWYRFSDLHGAGVDGHADDGVDLLGVELRYLFHVSDATGNDELPLGGGAQITRDRGGKAAHASFYIDVGINVGRTVRIEFFHGILSGEVQHSAPAVDGNAPVA